MKAPTLRICILALALTTVACGDPVGVKKLTARDQYRQLQGNALTTDTPSDAAEIVLRRHNLVETYADQPELALETLRAATFSYGPNNGDDLFALAELSHQYADSTGSRPYALASALYAYAFLFPTDPTLRPKPIDARYRWAADIYAAGLTQALAAPDGQTLDLKAGTYPLPFGTAVIQFDAHETEWSGRTLTDFVPTEQFEIYGLNNRYRQPGIGVPLAAKPVVTASHDGEEFVAKQIRVPATAVLLIEDPRLQVAGDTVNGRTLIQPRTPYEPTTSPSTTIASGPVPILNGQRSGKPLTSRSGRRRGYRLRRLGLRRLYFRRLGLRRALDETGDGIGDLGAALLPERHAVDGEAQRLLVRGRDGIVEADALDEAPVAPVARIRDDDVEEGALLGAAASQSDDDHVCPVPFRQESFLFYVETAVAGKRTPQDAPTPRIFATR